MENSNEHKTIEEIMAYRLFEEATLKAYQLIDKTPKKIEIDLGYYGFDFMNGFYVKDGIGHTYYWHDSPEVCRIMLEKILP